MNSKRMIYLLREFIENDIEEKQSGVDEGIYDKKENAEAIEHLRDILKEVDEFERDTSEALGLLKASLHVMNQIPNTKMSIPGGFNSTYELASAISKLKL